MDNLKVGDKVAITTFTGGCYNGKTGTIVNILNGAMTPLDRMPKGSPNRFPYWYRVQFDEPASNGGEPVIREIFLLSELKLIDDVPS